MSRRHPCCWKCALTTLLFLVLAGCGLLSSDGLLIDSVDKLTLPVEVADSYLFDAGALVMDLLPNDRRRTAPIELDPDLLSSFHNGLLHILQNPDLPGWDRVRAIRHFERESVRRIGFIVDNGPDWIGGSGEAPIPEADQIMKAYGLTVYSSGQGAAWWYVTLTAPRPINMYGVTQALDRLTGIHSPSPYGYFGDGDDIKAKVTLGGIDFRFSTGWGDCPAGCIYRHYWDYRVLRSGQVVFLGEGGGAATLRQVPGGRMASTRTRQTVPPDTHIPLNPRLIPWSRPDPEAAQHLPGDSVGGRSRVWAGSENSWKPT